MLTEGKLVVMFELTEPISLGPVAFQPSEAAKVLGISRPLVVHLLETKKIEGYRIGVGKHWKVKRNSVLSYLEERDDLAKAFSEMDKAGFGLD